VWRPQAHAGDTRCEDSFEFVARKQARVSALSHGSQGLPRIIRVQGAGQFFPRTAVSPARQGIACVMEKHGNAGTTQSLDGGEPEAVDVPHVSGEMRGKDSGVFDFTRAALALLSPYGIRA